MLVVEKAKKQDKPVICDIIRTVKPEVLTFTLIELLVVMGRCCQPPAGF